MKRVALIPARLGSTRFPGKLLAMLGGRTIIRRTFDAVATTGLFDDVMVVSDSEVIRDEVVRHGGHAVLSRREHESGTDRIAEVAEGLDAELILNVQGDTPFIEREALERLLQTFDGPDGRDVQVGSLMRVLSDPLLIANPNTVKVAVDLRRNALFFSRAVIPHARDRDVLPVYYEHIGVYGFRRAALLEFPRWGPSPLERIEKIECLRFLEHGIPIRMAVATGQGVEIDTPEDLERAERLLATRAATVSGDGATP